MKPNKYEHLRVPEFSDSEPLRDYESTTIYNDRVEAIVIHIAPVAHEKYALGYSLIFNNGSKANRLPSCQNGYFRSKTDAMLYMLGYINQFSNYFSEDCISEVMKRMNAMSQPILF